MIMTNSKANGGHLLTYAHLLADTLVIGGSNGRLQDEES